MEESISPELKWEDFREVIVKTTKGNFNVVTNIKPGGNINSLEALLDNWSIRMTKSDTKDLASMKRSLIEYVNKKEEKYQMGLIVVASTKVLEAIFLGEEAMEALTDEEFFL